MMRFFLTVLFCLSISRRCYGAEVKPPRSDLLEENLSKRPRVSRENDPELVGFANALLLLQTSFVPPAEAASVSVARESGPLEPSLGPAAVVHSGERTNHATKRNREDQTKSINADGSKSSSSRKGRSKPHLFFGFSIPSWIGKPRVELDLNYMGFGYGLSNRVTDENTEALKGPGQTLKGPGQAGPCAADCEPMVLEQRTSSTTQASNMSTISRLSWSRVDGLEVLPRLVAAACIEGSLCDLESLKSKVALESAELVDPRALSNENFLFSVMSFDEMAGRVPWVAAENLSREQVVEFLRANRQRFGQAVRAGQLVIFPDLFAKLLLMQGRDTGVLEVLEGESGTEYFPVIQVSSGKSSDEEVQVGASANSRSSKVRDFVEGTVLDQDSDTTLVPTYQTLVPTHATFVLNKVPWKKMLASREAFSVELSTTQLNRLGSLSRTCHQIYAKSVGQVRDVSTRGLWPETMHARMEEIFDMNPIEAWRFVRPDKCMVGLLKLVEQFEAKVRANEVRVGANEANLISREANLVSKEVNLISSGPLGQQLGVNEARQVLLRLVDLVGFVEIYDFSRVGKDSRDAGNMARDGESVAGPRQSLGQSIEQSVEPFSLVASLKSRIDLAYAEFVTAIYANGAPMPRPAAPKTKGTTVDGGTLDPTVSNGTSSKSSSSKSASFKSSSSKRSSSKSAQSEVAKSKSASTATKPKLNELVQDLESQPALVPVDVEFDFHSLGLSESVILTRESMGSVLSPLFFPSTHVDGGQTNTDGQAKTGQGQAIMDDAIRAMSDVVDRCALSVESVRELLPATVPEWAARNPIMYFRLTQVVELLHYLLNTVWFETKAGLTSNCENGDTLSCNSRTAEMSFEEALMHFSANRVGPLLRLNEFLISYSDLEVLLLTESKRITSDLEIYRLVPKKKASYVNLVDVDPEVEQASNKVDEKSASEFKSSIPESKKSVPEFKSSVPELVEVIRVRSHVLRESLAANYLWRSLEWLKGQRSHAIDSESKSLAEDLRNFCSNFGDLSAVNFAQWFRSQSALLTFGQFEGFFRTRLRLYFVYFHRVIDPRKCLASALAKLVELRSMIDQYRDKKNHLSPKDSNPLVSELSEIQLTLKGIRLSHLIVGELVFGGTPKDDVLESQISAARAEVNKLEREQVIMWLRGDLSVPPTVARRTAP